ncbi:1-acyl-sn-glycerol-3-phosphate acyltransferase [bacterium]|nr:1-acyl-sn-glycerol-3-phosphate acyltransferase [bacterium]
MIRTILWFTYFWIYMILSLVVFIPIGILLLIGRRDLLDRLVVALSTRWARDMIWAAGGKVSISGLENLPDHNRLCFISNHQGSFDIPLVIGYVPRTIGFIAKKEMLKFPVISFWMKAMHCLFIDRSNARKALKTVGMAVEYIQQEKPILIFPEGTRSKGDVMGPFKKGSMKIPIRVNATIVPLTIDGSWKMRERTGWISPGSIKLTVHPPVEVDALSDEEKRRLHEILQEIIGGPLPH